MARSSACRSRSLNDSGGVAAVIAYALQLHPFEIAHRPSGFLRCLRCSRLRTETKPQGKPGECFGGPCVDGEPRADAGLRSEEHTSELQSLRHLVCRLLLEK